MRISIAPKKEYICIPGKKLRLNIQIEYPPSSWKYIKVSIRFHETLGIAKIERTITEKSEANFCVIQQDIILPDVLGRYKLGSIEIESNGDIDYEDLPHVNILTHDAYFEEQVAETMRKLGFHAKRYGGPKNPDVVATHPFFPEQKFHVEATTQAEYDISKFRSDKAKFDELKLEFKFKHLLIVSLASPSDITRDVYDRLKKTSDPVSLICYEDLENMAREYTGFRVSSYEIFATLNQSGFICLEKR
jgi:hypothetical protein